MVRDLVTNDVTVPAVVEKSSQVDLFDTDKMQKVLALAGTISQSSLIPEHFQRKPEDCFIALYRSYKLGCDPFGFMEQTYVVHGKLGVQGQLIIALLNSSGKFEDPIQFDLTGEGDNRKCVAYAKIKGGKRIEAECSIAMAIAEGWYNKSGSKWKTLPDLMLRYRSATFLGRLYAPELMLGIRTVDELHDIEEDTRKSLFPAEPQAATIEEIPVAEEIKPELESKKEEPTPIPPTESEKKTPISKMRNEVAAVFQDTPTDFDMYCRAKKWCGSAECYMDVPDSIIEKVYGDLPKVKDAFQKWIQKSKAGSK